ncbi:hypothetical protein FRC07_008648, partial [Ceratobasidium sp. 392]
RPNLPPGTDAKLRELKPARLASYDPNRRCISGTRTGVIDQLAHWAHSTDAGSRLAWVHGPAGFGKSSIATSVCLRLDAQRALASGFFCKRDSPELRDPLQVLATIAYGLALRCEPYKDAVISAIRGDPELHSRHLQPLYDALLGKPLQTLAGGTQPGGRLVVVVDALDECGDASTRRQLLACLRSMSQIGPWLRLIVTSRPDLDIREFFAGAEAGWFAEYNVLQYDASDDIRTFVQNELGDMEPVESWPNDAVEQISQRASGLFIWARTACRFIMDGLDQLGRLKLVLAGNRLADIDSLYRTAIEAGMLDAAGDNRD